MANGRLFSRQMFYCNQVIDNMKSRRYEFIHQPFGKPIGSWPGLFYKGVWPTGIWLSTFGKGPHMVSSPENRRNY
jgi:hypothetical protein